MSSLKKVRKLAGALCAIAILCQLLINFLNISKLLINILSAVSIICSIGGVFVIIKWHRCPRCHAFVQLTARPEECLHCGCSLRN